MKSFQTLYTDIQNQTGDDSAAFLTQIKRWINETQGLALANHKGKIREKTATITTAASTARYTLPADCDKILKVTTTPDSGTTVYTPHLVEDPDFWEHLQGLNQSSSLMTEYYYREGNDLLLWPSYSTASKTITVRYRKRVIEMSRADYTTGTITTATLGDETIVGSSTVWTGRKPVGEQWLRIAQTAGDYQWYRIETITDDTNIELEAKYQGTSIAAGSSTYTIGEFPAIHPDFHDLCFYRPMALAYLRLENTEMANTYWDLYDGGCEAGRVSKPAGLLKRFMDADAGTLDAVFYSHQADRGAVSAEERSLNQAATFN